MTEEHKKIFPYAVEGVSFDSPEEKVTAESIIYFAQEKGVPAAQDSVEKLTLKSEKTIYSGDDLVNLSQDNIFSLGVKVYKFTVNGQALESNSGKLVVLDIIEMAKKEDVHIPGKPEELFLEVVGGTSKFKIDDWVDLSQFHEFILILNKQTPVA